ncbi:MAG: HAD family hydrolase [Candidatus Brocadiaceae bacterium]|jgi:HAD superfamily hydrolase (TIGR01549 family)
MPAISELKAVFFDVSGPLWDRAACERQVMEIVLPRFIERLPEDDLESIIRRFNAVFFELPGKKHFRERRPFSRLRRFEALLESYQVRARGLARELTHTYDTTRRLILRQFTRPQAPSVLRELGRRGLQRGVIMNGQAALQRHLLESLGLNPYLEHTVFAEVEGYSKPDVRLFKRTLELVGLESEEMLYVGDSPLTDLLGAARAGIPTVWFQTGRRRLPRGFPTPDFTVNSLPELLSVVQM